jgi:hypothetical protein
MCRSGLGSAACLEACLPHDKSRDATLQEACRCVCKVKRGAVEHKAQKSRRNMLTERWIGQQADG